MKLKFSGIITIMALAFSPIEWQAQRPASESFPSLKKKSMTYLKGLSTLLSVGQKHCTVSIAYPIISNQVAQELANRQLLTGKTVEADLKQTALAFDTEASALKNIEHDLYCQKISFAIFSFLLQTQFMKTQECASFYAFQIKTAKDDTAIQQAKVQMQQFDKESDRIRLKYRIPQLLAHEANKVHFDLFELLYKNKQDDYASYQAKVEKGCQMRINRTQVK